MTMRRIRAWAVAMFWTLIWALAAGLVLLVVLIGALGLALLTAVAVVLGPNG